MEDGGREWGEKGVRGRWWEGGQDEAEEGGRGRKREREREGARDRERDDGGKVRKGNASRCTTSSDACASPIGEQCIASNAAGPSGMR